jgi:uncharacterized membrane protein YedE/YeeE
MTQFTPLSALAGGALIGLAAAVLMLTNGRIAGISGIAGGLLRPHPGEIHWRVAFLGGLILAPLLLRTVGGAVPEAAPLANVPVLIAAGLLVGFGTRLGGGCTSGHGVCGIARFSMRSVLATATFMAAAIVTVLVTRHLV